MICSGCGKKITNKQTYFAVQVIVNHRKKTLEEIKSPMCKNCKETNNGD